MGWPVPEVLHTREDVWEAVEELMASGFGELTVKVSEHKIAQVELLIRRRKAPRAARPKGASV
jgi:hypothetical protein